MERRDGPLAELRKLLWHYRSGGVEQVRARQLRERAEIGIRTPENIRGAEGGWIGRGKKRRLTFSPFEIQMVQPATDLKVAVILDEFSEQALGYEWVQTRVQRTGWYEQLREAEFDLLFVESAWNGNGGEWKYQLTGDSGPKNGFLEMVRYCKKIGLPTVFWNKEDPPHYDDFIRAAAEFDFVFTSDARKIPDYVRDLGHDRIGVLPFAAQPRIHNPIRPRFGFHARDIAFAGMYFRDKYPERRQQMEYLLGGAADSSTSMEIGLEIFSRQLDGPSEYQFPHQLENRVVGSLKYIEMLTAYKAYKIFLNVNSVQDSPSMCARRVFEISASGTPVISTPSLAISEFFSSDEVPIAENRIEAKALAQAFVQNEELNSRTAHKAQRSIWTNHVYAKRVELITATVLPSRLKAHKRPPVSALVPTFRPQQVDHIFASIARQRNVDVELILLTHGFEYSKSEAARIKELYPLVNVTFLTRPREIPLGTCLNICLEASSGEVVAKMDDDDHYGNHYLSDQLHALDYSGAQIVGKQAHYMYLTSLNATILRNREREHRFTNHVMGPTIVAKADFTRSILFPEIATGEDTGFLRNAGLAGADIYSADRFNFYQVRGSRNHTWKISDIELMATSKLTQYGKPDDHTDV